MTDRRRFAAIMLASLVLAGCAASPGSSAAQSPIAQSPAEGGTVTDLRLHDAATAGDLAGIDRLVAGGVDLDGRDADGRTPVMAATVARQTEAVRRLIAAGADVDIRDNRLDNPFLYAGAEGLLDILVLVGEAGADPTITNRYGGVALIPACERGHVAVVEYLLEHTGVNVNHVNNLGWTGLLEAIILSDGGPDHQRIVRLLIEHGADVNLADDEGVTPRAHARSRGFDAIVAMLEAAGAR